MNNHFLCTGRLIVLVEDSTHQAKLGKERTESNLMFSISQQQQSRRKKTAKQLGTECSNESECQIDRVRIFPDVVFQTKNSDAGH
jgi:hypothetical protein